MAYILFRRSATPTPDSTLAPYAELSEFFDDIARNVYRSQEGVTTPSPFEVAVDFELARYAARPGLARVVRYAGNGEVYTEDEGVTAGPGSGGVCTLEAPDVVPSPAVDTGAGASITVTCRQGVQPYTVTVRVQQQAAAVATATSASTSQPAQITGLTPARYQVTVTDAVGCTRTALLDVFGGTTGNGPYGPDLRVTYSFNNGFYRTFWNPATKAVENFSRNAGPGDDPNSDFDNYTPPGQQVDGYLLPDGYTWRVVSSDGQGGVYFTDSDTRKPGLLELHNVILFHPDVPGQATGGVLIECNATDYPLSFQLGDGTGTTFGPPNSTGHFDGLSADDYAVTVTDAEGRTLVVPFSLRARYAKRWVLNSDSLDSVPWRVEIWKLGHDGAEVGTLCADGNTPVELATDGLNSSIGGQGDLPAAVGSSLRLSLLATLDELQEIQLAEDRGYRADYYLNNALEFRGYVTPDVYTADLLDGLVPISLTATDGLAALKETVFTGHVGQVLTGRWPLLNTLLHCLSRCDVSLPLRVATNRRPVQIGSRVAPEAVVTTERAGYQDDKNEPLDMRQVVEAIAQTLGGTLVQREGAWQIRSSQEAAGVLTQSRLYAPAGSVTSPRQALHAPAEAVKPPQTVRAAGTGWHWLDNEQQLRIRAGWKSLTAKTDVQYAKNALPAGDVFGNDVAWNQSLDALLPTAGWSDNAADPGFPLLLLRAGEKDTDLGAKWPRRLGTADNRYLQSGQLPNATEPEDVPWTLSVTGRLVIPGPDGSTIILPPTPGVGRSATVAIELVIDGQRPATPFYAVFELADTARAGATTVTFDLGPLPAQSRVARLRFSPWDGTVTQDAVLLIEQVTVAVKPSGATWDGKDTFRADSNMGTVRPTEPVAVFHADVPLKAGLFEGTAYAFRRATTVAGGALTTVWARATDLAPAPLLESAALDGLALRAAPSRLLEGPLRYYGAPPRMLDAVDCPYDLNGRRFLVASVRDNPRASVCVVSLVEIGVGATLAPVDPTAGLPAGVRLLDGVSFPVGTTPVPGQGRPRVRATHHGLRIAKTQ